MDDGRKVITIAHPEQSSGELKRVLHSYCDTGIRLFSLLFALIVTYMTYRIENKIIQYKKK